MAKIGKYSCPHCDKDHPRLIDVCPETNRAVPETFRLEGEVIDGKYEVCERIGKGGMGVVYKAIHLTIGRRLAIKFLHTDVQTSEEVVLRFQNEARIAASIGHKNIVDIIDMGNLRRKFYYIVMEYLEGEDLADILEEKGKLLPNEAVDITIQVLSGLYAAHAKGIIHRDLKPENIFIVYEPGGEKHLKIVDFGISRLIQETSEKKVRETKEGMVIGTPLYMSPEQARGRINMDHRADLYGIGAILYEMLTGVPTFESDNISDTLVSIITEIPSSPCEIEPSVSGKLSDMVMKSLAKNPDDRFQDAHEFIEAIAPFSSTPIFAKYSNHHIHIGDSTSRVTKEPSPQELDSESSVEVKVEKAPRLDDEIHGRSSPPLLKTQPVDILPEMTKIERKSTSAKKTVVLIVILLVVVSVSVSAAFHYRFCGASKPDSNVNPYQLKAEKTGFNNENNTKVKRKLPLWSIGFNSLPEGADVFVDNILHSERPVMVEDSPHLHIVRIKVNKNIIHEEKIYIKGDIVVSVKTAKLIEKEMESVEKKTAVKPSKKRKKGKKAKDKIDQDYPG